MKKMVNPKRSLMVFVLVAMMVFALAACGKDSSSEGSGDSNTSEANGGPYSIGYTLLISEWILTEHESISKQVVMDDNPDNKFTSVDGNANADTMQSGLLNMISAGIDGLTYMPSFGTLTPVMIDMCEEAGVSFVGFCHPLLDDQIDDFADNPLSAGYIGSNDFQRGYQMGEFAIKDGGKIAMVTTGTEGMKAPDDRKDGFVAAFEEGGGKVVAVTHCESGQVVVSKVSDALTAHPEVDTAYCITGSSGIGNISVFENFNRKDINLYVSDLDGDLLDSMRDGVIKAGDGGDQVQVMLATTLLMNKLAGHQIFDENGKAPVTDKVPTLIVMPENADLFQSLFIDQKPFTDATINNLLYSKNQDVSWADYQDLIDNFSFEWLEAQS